ncbi:MAG: type II toxin-antitoxin system ParD family antitoxin [Okeania sp. SIO3B5]|uniref:ribbon-helix-helix domain-containing protein n=1 Tax=Okeania sp. SIO3B5 TaxID=2607811 RepID=UPI0014010C5E|nr:type II toxin-antitoxin system ParD family antitoxin [Okeania sp. SIO3B5]NEO56844.1 type II toxin-antitoxin system ParD family antitoxin [Okeania sp. SIO3B5]
MNIILSPEQEKFIQSQIAKGRYTNIQQAIDVALKLLEKQEQDYQEWLDETRAQVKVGLEQLERGEKVYGEIVIAQLKQKFKQLREENLGE